MTTAPPPSSFPDMYRSLETAYLMQVYEAAPDRLRRALSGLSAAERAARPRPEAWSVQEIAVHLTDAEIMGCVRFRQTFAEPGSTFAVYDQDVWADRMRYASWDRDHLDAAVDLFEAMRRMNALLLRSARPEDWSKQAVHPELGTVTLRQLLELYADHGERHLDQIRSIRDDLGRPLDLEALLEERLY